MHTVTGSTIRELGYRAGQARARPFHHPGLLWCSFISLRPLVHCLVSLPTSKAAGSSSLFPAQRSAASGSVCGEVHHIGRHDAVFLVAGKAENRRQKTHHDDDLEVAVQLISDESSEDLLFQGLLRPTIKLSLTWLKRQTAGFQSSASSLIASILLFSHDTMHHRCSTLRIRLGLYDLAFVI